MNFICYSCGTNNKDKFIKELEKIARKVEKKSKGKRLNRDDIQFNLGIGCFLNKIKEKIYICVLCGKEISGYRYLTQNGLCESCEGMC